MTTPARKIIHLSHSVERFRRCLQVGNPVTIKLAYNELTRELNRLSPIDLANVVKIATAIKPQHKLEQSEVVSKILSECVNRKWSKFSPTDSAVITTAVAKMRLSEFLPKLCQKLSTTVPEMRTTDLCVTLWALVRLSQGSSSETSELIKAGMASLLANDQMRLRQLNNVNLTQLMYVLVRSNDAVKTLDGIKEIVDFVLRGLGSPSRLMTFSNEAIPFNIYALVEVLEKMPVKPDDRLIDSFFESARAELNRRTDLKPTEVIDIFRALGRAHQVNREMVDERLIPVLSQTELSQEHIRGITHVLKSVGYADVESVIGKLTRTH